MLKARPALAHPVIARRAGDAPTILPALPPAAAAAASAAWRLHTAPTDWPPGLPAMLRWPGSKRLRRLPATRCWCRWCRARMGCRVLPGAERTDRLRDHASARSAFPAAAGQSGRDRSGGDRAAQAREEGRPGCPQHRGDRRCRVGTTMAAATGVAPGDRAGAPPFELSPDAFRWPRAFEVPLRF